MIEKPPITTVEVSNFDIWYETKDPNFTDISLKSNIPETWLLYRTIMLGPNRDSIIKPINRYVERLVPPPKLISIENNIVRLRQGNHAELFLLEKEDGSFYNVDRPWQRQYYNTELDLEAKDCFPGTFKFYVPWFIDEDVVATIEPSPVESPFHTYFTIANFRKVPPITEFVEPEFIPFRFKRVGSHMVNDKFAKVPRQSPMYDIVFHANDIIVERVRKFYEEKE